MAELEERAFDGEEENNASGVDSRSIRR